MPCLEQKPAKMSAFFKEIYECKHRQLGIWAQLQAAQFLQIPVVAQGRTGDNVANSALFSVFSACAICPWMCIYVYTCQGGESNSARALIYSTVAFVAICVSHGQAFTK